VLYLRVIAFAQDRSSFELIFEGRSLERAIHSGRKSSAPPHSDADPYWRQRWSAAFGLLGIWLALSVTAIFRGIAMILFWKAGKWRTVRVEP